jgi:hypothetical protein
MEREEQEMLVKLGRTVAVRVTDVRRGEDRGDVPGWVLVTLMTAGLVLGLWAAAGPALENVFSEAMKRVLGF